MGNAKSFMASVFRMKWLLKKLMHGPVHLFHTPHVVSLQSLEWREVGLKLPWPVVSFKPHWCDQYLCCWNANADFYTPPIPLHWTFHSLSIQKALGNICMNMQSFLFTHPRVVSPVWCWASDRQFALCGVSSVSLASRVCSYRVVLVHLACLACTAIQRWVPSVRVMRKSGFQQRTHEHLVYCFFMS